MTNELRDALITTAREKHCGGKNRAPAKGTEIVVLRGAYQGQVLPLDKRMDKDAEGAQPWRLVLADGTKVKFDPSQVALARDLSDAHIRALQEGAKAERGAIEASIAKDEAERHEVRLREYWTNKVLDSQLDFRSVRHDYHGELFVEIAPFHHPEGLKGANIGSLIEVRGRQRLADAGIPDVTVNWSAIGAVSPTMARKMARALDHAADIAEQYQDRMEKELGLTPTDGKRPEGDEATERFNDA